jgi:hypothetical protein
MAAKHQKINFIIFAKTVVQLQIWIYDVLQIFNKNLKQVRLKNRYIGFQKGLHQPVQDENLCRNIQETERFQKCLLHY